MVKLYCGKGTGLDLENALIDTIGEIDSSEIIGNDGILSSNDLNSVDWVLKYYDVISDKQAAKLWDYDINYVLDEYVDNLPGYNAHHIDWIVAKPQYKDILDGYDALEIVEEGGDIFPAQVAGGRLEDVSEYISEIIGDDEDLSTL